MESFKYYMWIGVEYFIKYLLACGIGANIMGVWYILSL